MRLFRYQTALALLVSAFLVPVIYAETITEDINISVTIPKSGGGGDGYTSLTINGYAYPNAVVTILRNGSVVGTAVADASGKFSKTASVLGGIATIGVWARDDLGLNSQTSEITVYLTHNALFEISDLYLSPTISLSRTMALPGVTVRVFGSSFPQSLIRLFTDIPEIDPTTYVVTNANGHWEYFLNTTGLAYKTYSIQANSQSEILKLTSPLSQKIKLQIGAILPPFPEGITCTGVDFNGDGKVDVIDFSIMLFYWELNPLEVEPPNACVDQDGNNLVNIYDFSRLMYGWKE
jgi:hypothetical protein